MTPPLPQSEAVECQKLLCGLISHSIKFFFSFNNCIMNLIEQVLYKIGFGIDWTGSWVILYFIEHLSPKAGASIFLLSIRIEGHSFRPYLWLKSKLRPSSSPCLIPSAFFFFFFGGGGDCGACTY